MNTGLAVISLSVQNAGAILLGVLALGIVVLIHELGHFIVAKLRGVRVEVFSIGFPPKIFSIRRGETEYCISWILCGGYVKLAGMEPDEGVDPRAVPDGFYAGGIVTRLAVCLCGPLMNLLSAFIIYLFLYLAGFPVPLNMERTVIGSVREGSPAAEAGLKPGDRVLSIAGRPVERWEEVTKGVVYSPPGPLSVEFERGGERINRLITPVQDGASKLKYIGILPEELVFVETLPGGAAAAAGIRNGDFIMSADGEAVHSWEQLTSLIRSREGKQVRLDLMRRGARQTVLVTPTFNKELGYPAIGVRPRPVVSMADLEANGLVVYIYRDPFTWIGRNVREMYLTFKGLIMRSLSPRGLAGPIGIVQIMSYSAQAGVRQFLFVLAFISVNLAVLNLLPIPVLDGGHILIALIEGARGRPLGMRAMTMVQNIFMAIFIALMVLVMANDVMRSWGEQITRVIGWRPGQRPEPAPLKQP
ncbi:MAG: RIP metalloprotease RseP [Candidatus Aureabacteria bacterium]|nr:RIP metalloprotease RseP [Candidatus Auribacterota bacterium]